MLNRPFSFYLMNDGGMAKILGVEPIDNDFTYNVSPGEGNYLKNHMPIKIDVFTDEEKTGERKEFSFGLKYSDVDGRVYKLIIHIKKMEIKSLTETELPGVHQYTN